MDRRHERPSARPIRRRPARLHQLRTNHRRRVLSLPPTTTSDHQQQRTALTNKDDQRPSSRSSGGPLARGNHVVPSRWQATSSRLNRLFCEAKLRLWNGAFLLNRTARNHLNWEPQVAQQLHRLIDRLNCNRAPHGRMLGLCLEMFGTRYTSDYQIAGL